jgi:hypothetical protein
VQLISFFFFFLGAKNKREEENGATMREKIERRIATFSNKRRVCICLLYYL